jgi:hypothetical protein
MKRSSGPRKTATLSESIHHQLNMYAIAASTAGVSVLALVQPAEAKIIYIPLHEQAAGVKLTLNERGRADFKFHAAFGSTGSDFRIVPLLKSNRISNTTAGNELWAAALPAGVKVGGNGHFNTFGNSYSFKFMAACGNSTTFTCRGPWVKVKQKYLGLKVFDIQGRPHYGWARLTTDWENHHKMILTGYAYETIPNKAIVTGRTKGTDDRNIEQSNPAAFNVPTPEPATLGALAMGAPGLSIWRRKEASLDGQ